VPNAFRRLVPLVVLAAAVAAACQPPKQPAKAAPTPPPPGLFITYYLSNDSGGWFRSVAPHSRTLSGGATASQALLPDGSVALDLADLVSITNGGSAFMTVPGRLGDIDTIQLQLASTCCEGVQLLLLFDLDGDGEFGDWDAAGNGTFGGGDESASVETQATSLTVDDSTLLHVTNFDFTLGDIKAGMWMPAIDEDTSVAILIRFGIFNPPPDAGGAVASALLVNGVDLLVP